MIGDGENMIDFTYVDNVVHAHLCAERALNKGGNGPEDPSGKVIKKSKKISPPMSEIHEKGFSEFIDVDKIRRQRIKSWIA